MKKTFFIALGTMCLLFASCAAGPNPAQGTPDTNGDTAGFFMGLWHGIITPVTFIISLFTADVNVYDVHNNGGWYNFGFVLGLSIIFGGSSGGTCAAKRRRHSSRREE